ncbi:MAG: Ig-like domain-containing protein [Bacteroidota bacterium]
MRLSTHYVAFFFISFFLLLFSSCKQKTDTSQIAPEVLSNYITGYTTGIIGKDQQIRVQFPNAVVEQRQVGQPEKRALVSFSPKVTGQFTWDNTRTLAFTPDGGWTPGEQYLATVDLKGVYDTISALSEYTFSFAARETRVTVEVRGIYTPDEGKMSEQAIGGVIKSNDRLDVKALEGLISATQNGRSLKVNYVDAGDITYDFVVSGVQRGEEASEVQIKWDAASIELGTDKGVTQKGVPALGVFKVVSVDYVNGGSPHLSIRFSDPLDREQNLNGLIRLPGGGDLRHRISGNIITTYVGPGLTGSKVLTLAENIKNAAGKNLGRSVDWQVNFTRPAPQLIAVGEEVIMPHTGKRLFPFEAVGLEAVRVEIFKIFDSNVLQFLQENSLNSRSGQYELRKVGRIIAQERVLLSDLASDSDLDDQTRYAIDLSKYIEDDHKAIYQVRIGFGMDDVRRQCSKTLADYGIAKAEYEDVEVPLVGFKTEKKSIMGS